MRQGKLHAACPTDHAPLQEMIASTLRAAHGDYAEHGAALPISRPSAAQPLLLIAMPSPGTDRLPLCGRNGAAIFVIDPDQRASPSQALLMRLFDLTPTESKLASRLAEGTALGDVAQQLGMQPDTARKHVKSIFRKTGANRQSDLVRLVVNSAAVLERAPKPPRGGR
jgi:DNA-binding CsgD family transcriptional regulator